MEKKETSEYLAPIVKVITVNYGQEILAASGGFNISNDQVSSGDEDDVWEN